MANPRQQLFAPVGGMNQDDSIIAPTPKYAGRNAFSEGDYKYLLNARVGSSNSDNFGDVETIKGTVEVTTYMVRSAGKKWAAGTRPTGTERVLGKYADKETQRLFYAVYNSNGDHCIRFYDPYYNAVFELLKWSGLAFESTYFVKFAMIDNWLSFTDRENAPRLVDVNTITDLKNTLGSDFREYHISFHKWGPVMPPRIKAYYDGVTNNYDTFEDKVFQWSYRYIYDGRLKSRWSPISMASQHFRGNAGNEITHILIEIPGFNLDDPGVETEYNYFGNDDDKFVQAAEFIEIAYREGSRDVWRLFKRFEVEESGNTSFIFDGETSNSTPIPVEDFYQLFDTVPFKAGTVEAIDNRFVFADILDENDPADIPIVTDIGIVSFDASQTLDNLWNDGYSDASDNENLYSGMSAADADILGNLNRTNFTTFKGRGLYKLGIQWIAANGWRSAVYTTDDWIYEITEESGTIDKIYALEFKFDPSFRPPEWAVAYQIVRTNCLNIDYFMFGAANAFEPIIDNSTEPSDLTGAAESMRDRLRQHFEGARSVTGLDFEKYLTTLFNKSIFKSIAADVRDTAAAALADSSRIYINVNNWYNSSKKNAGGTQNNPMNNLFYNYREGDRVRFMASTTAAPTDEQKTVYDEEILEFTGRGIIVKKPAGITWLPTDAAGTDGKDFVIEVYTPKIPGDADYLYHEVGEWYPVLYPGTDLREMSKRDWTFTNAAAITCETYGDIKVFNNKPFSYGDCHGIQKTLYYNIKTNVSGSVSNNLYSASMNPDDDKTYDFWEKCNGRSAPAYTDLPVSQFKPTTFRFGGQIVEQSFVNQINRFREEDQKTFPSEYGRVRYIVATANAQVESVGTILLAIGERETFSIYVNRTTLEDLSGRTQVTLSDRILGSYNTLLGSHGTLNPESVSFRRGRVWFWDAINGMWIRYGRDGLTPISKYKMKTWFKELGRLVIDAYPVIDTDPPVINSLPSWTDLGNGAATWGLNGSLQRTVTLGSFQVSNWLAHTILNPVSGTYEFEFSATGSIAGGSGNTAQLTVHFLDQFLNIIESSTPTNIPNAGAVDVAVSLAASPNAPFYVMIQVNNLTSSSNVIVVSDFTLTNGEVLTPPIVHETPVVISEFDPFNEELITFINHSSLPATFRDYSNYKGAVFNEDDVRWKYIHDFTPEMFGVLNDQLYSFKAGTVYKHEANAAYSTFYGTKYDVKIEPVFNNLPKDMKSWQGITLITTHGWSVERLLSEYRGAKTKQQSSINLDDFEEKEDGYFAAIKNDANTPLVSYPLINGNKMRSKAIRALLKLDPSITTMSLLHYVLMGEIDSPKNS